MTEHHRLTGEGANGAPARRRLMPTGAMVLLAAIFIALGTWQVQRLFWKLDLIARVDARVHAEAVDAPSPAEWPSINVQKDEYRHVRAAGTFAYDKSVLVQAVTERGAGFWLLTPLMRADNSIILINRGFLPSERRDEKSRKPGETAGNVAVTGLLRMPEPGGGFLRSNDAADDRWYSRDVAAIATAKGLMKVAPYFIDADASPNAGGLPIGGLTVISFRNSHLVYALTWYVLAMMSAAGAIVVSRKRAA